MIGGLKDSFGWDSVFYFLIFCIGFSVLLVTQFMIKDLKSFFHNRNLTKLEDSDSDF